MTAVRRQLDQRTLTTIPGDGHRDRLLDGLAASIAERGYSASTVADIVRHARTSRRTFYEHFAGKDECLIALLTAVNTMLVERISASIDRTAPWRDQIRRGVETWIACAEADPAVMVCAIRDLPSLNGDVARRLHRQGMEAFVATIQTACDTDEWRAAGAGRVSRETVLILVGGLYELAATTVEDGRRLSEITETAVQSSIALLAPREPVLR
ncbi:TetR/AcrR family transcriptional regulator [Actinomadura yumaensis]|uniref:TetR/AcrR family transcriptional regulator n=1 Tax=Actinomadura yumaensis TaxID=111807 RepID=A0ABW2CKT3_9ACTN